MKERNFSSCIFSVFLLLLYFFVLYYLYCFLCCTFRVIYFLCCIICAVFLCYIFVCCIKIISLSVTYSFTIRLSYFFRALNKNVALRVGKLGMLNYHVIYPCLFQNFLSVSELNFLLIF